MVHSRDEAAARASLELATSPTLPWQAALPAPAATSSLNPMDGGPSLVRTPRRLPAWVPLLLGATVTCVGFVGVKLVQAHARHVHEEGSATPTASATAAPTGTVETSTPDAPAAEATVEASATAAPTATAEARATAEPSATPVPTATAAEAPAATATTTAAPTPAATAAASTTAPARPTRPASVAHAPPPPRAPAPAPPAPAPSAAHRFFGIEQ
jgi:cytoskeletal protein RodZ